MPDFTCKFPLGYLKGALSSKGFIFTQFVYSRNFGQIWIKIIE